MKIRSFIHKGLKRLYAEGSTKGVPADTADKLRKMFAFIDSMVDPERAAARNPIGRNATGSPLPDGRGSG